MPPAAAAPLRNDVGSVQNVGNMLFMPRLATARPSRISHGDGASATTSQPAAPRKAATATCPRRSPVRSELTPNATMPTTAATLGSAASSPIPDSDHPTKASLRSLGM